MAWDKYKKYQTPEEKKKNIENAVNQNVALCYHLPLFTDKYETPDEQHLQMKKQLTIKEMMRYDIYQISSVVKRAKKDYKEKYEKKLDLTVDEVQEWVSRDRKFQQCMAVCKLVEQDKYRGKVKSMIEKENQYIIPLMAQKKCKELADPKTPLNFTQNVQINDFSSMTQEQRNKTFQRLKKSLPQADFKEIK